MKKILYFILCFVLCFLTFSSSYASLNTDCFFYFWETKIDKSLNEYLLNSSKNIDFAKNENWEVYMKLYKENTKTLDYKINLAWNSVNFLKDNNYQTFFNYYIWPEKSSLDELILDFWEIIWPNIDALISIEALNYSKEFFISKDWKNYEKINLSNLDSFKFRYFKIIFVYIWWNKFKISENLKIRDIIFSKQNFTYLVKWNSWENLKIYSNFFCSNDKDYNKLNSYKSNNSRFVNTLKYTSWLKEYFMIFEENNSYSIVDSWVDTDWDWINDNEDNCKYDYNPNQLDSNTSWIWDICDDVDWDWILWKYDNCPYVYNPDQKDINNNKVWDVCEFDKDNDWVFDSLDNCINTANPDQKDDDNDGIWNACDNCNLYNPLQRDENNNSIWDVCEKAEKFAVDNDKDKDWILDHKDNCKLVSNPDQLDNDWDWVWDSCDNCIDIKNPKQEDKNKNNIWDMCEDFDWDWHIWYLDNCPYVYNPDQKDQNNNSIWDLCEDYDSDWILNFQDNCPYVYNPDQKDIDNDKIWDKCDKKDDRFVESNKYFFIWLIIFFFLIFNFLIYLMFKKMKKIENDYKKWLKNKKTNK